jgi:hypothetical protein
MTYNIPTPSVIPDLIGDLINANQPSCALIARGETNKQPCRTLYTNQVSEHIPQPTTPTNRLPVGTGERCAAAYGLDPARAEGNLKPAAKTPPP